MSGDLVRGMVCAIVAASLYGAAPAVQAVQARDEEAGRGMGVGLILRLVRRPLWLLALGGEFIGFLVEAYAFSAAPATVVAPLMACDLIFFVLVAALVLGERPSRWTVVGVATMATGVALLAIAFGGSAGLGATASDEQLLTFLVLAGAVCAVAAAVARPLLSRGRRVLAAGLFSLAGGISFGLATLATRQIGRSFTTEHPWQLLTTAAPYTLVGCSLFGIGLVQRGLQTSPLLTFPIVSATGALLPAALGAAVLDDQVPGGGGRIAFVAALVVLCLGVAVLGRDRARGDASLSAPKVG